MSTTARVCVAGITGRLGSKIAHNLLLHPSVHIGGFCRDASKLQDAIRSHPRVNVVEGSSSDLDAARAAVRGCSAVVCCYLGPNDLMIDGQKVLIDACVAENVGRYIASDYTVDYTRIQPTDIPPKEPMFRVREYLAGKPVEGVHVLIGVFMETWWAFLSGWRPKENSLSCWGTGDERWELTTYDTAAQYVAEVALDSSAVGVLKFRGDSLSTKDVAALLAKKYGERPRLESKGTLEELRAKCDEARKGDPMSLQNRPLFYSYFIQSGKATMGDDLDNSRYPSVKAASVADFLDAVDVRELRVFS